MKIFIAFETWGRIREAMRANGHEVWSCDVLPSEDDSPRHIIADVRTLDLSAYDLVGMHPPCTYLTGSGIHWNNRGRGWERTEEAIALVRWLMSHDVPWYLENPVGIISSRIRKPDQIIQPYEFSDDASKKTCLWLNRLDHLPKNPAKRFPGRWVACNGKPVERWANQTDSGQNRLGPSPTRWKERSRTYAGIAQAMADHWAPEKKLAFQLSA